MASKAPTKTSPKKSKPKARPKAKQSSKSDTRPDARPASARSGAPKSPEGMPVGVRSTTSAPAKQRPTFVPRAMASMDDDDVLMAHGGGGAGFGRCGGRLLSNRLEQQLCNRLGIAGVVHSHSPRHYEVRYPDGTGSGGTGSGGGGSGTPGQVAAYAPMIVLRGRGREGKSVVIEAVEEANAPILRKIIAFRSQYGQEFYIILVASDEVLDEVPMAAFDESCSATNVNTLIARLAE